jgi:four helix bundle protein
MIVAELQQVKSTQIWEKVRNLISTIYSVTSYGYFKQDLELKTQMRSACVLIESNIAEGFASFSLDEFAQFMDLTQSAISEANTNLSIAFSLGYLPPEKFANIKLQLKQLDQIAGSFVQGSQIDCTFDIPICASSNETYLSS